MFVKEINANVIFLNNEHNNEQEIVRTLDFEK